MKKNSKDIAKELLSHCNTPEGKKEVVNACLFILQQFSTGEPLEANSKSISGGHCGDSTTNDCQTWGECPV